MIFELTYKSKDNYSAIFIADAPTLQIAEENTNIRLVDKGWDTYQYKLINHKILN